MAGRKDRQSFVQHGKCGVDSIALIIPERLIAKVVDSEDKAKNGYCQY